MIERDQFVLMMPETFYERGDLEQARPTVHVTRLKFCTIFFIQILLYVCKKPEDK